MPITTQPVSPLNGTFCTMKATYKGRCASSGWPIHRGETIAWYPATKEAHKLFFVNPGVMDFKALRNPKTLLFKFVEARFNRWLEESSANDWEIRLMYEGDEAIYDRRGAIEQALEEAAGLADETGQPVAMHTFDFDSIWQP